MRAIDIIPAEWFVTMPGKAVTFFKRFFTEQEASRYAEEMSERDIWCSVADKLSNRINYQEIW